MSAVFCSFSRFEVCGIGRFLFLSCSDKYCGRRAALAAAVIAMASSEFTNAASVERVFDYLLACRPTLEVLPNHPYSQRLNSLDGCQRVMRGLRSSEAVEFMSHFHRSQPLSARWCHLGELERWFKRSSPDLASFFSFCPRAGGAGSTWVGITFLGFVCLRECRSGRDHVV